MNSQINYLAAKPRTGDRMQWPGIEGWSEPFWLSHRSDP